MANKIGYCVVKLGWEYNDEIMYQGEARGGAPSRVFLDKEKAEQATKEATAKEITGVQLRSYGYSIKDVIDRDRFVELAEVLESLKILNMFEFSKNNDRSPEYIVDDWWLELDAKVPDTCPLDKAIEIARCLELKFYEVVEVELDFE